jgi:ABC-type iron transport system FetAB ATPase subunit
MELFNRTIAYRDKESCPLSFVRFFVRRFSGERNRVHMAKLLRSGGNVLLLDEPTNGWTWKRFAGTSHRRFSQAAP